jgi:hypothetical protein
MMRQVATGREPCASALRRVQLLENGMQLRHLQARLLLTIGFPGDRRRLVGIVVSFCFREGERVADHRHMVSACGCDVRRV